MYCKYCGQKISEGDSFCPGCNKPVNWKSDDSEWIKKISEIAGLSDYSAESASGGPDYKKPEPREQQGPVGDSVTPRKRNSSPLLYLTGLLFILCLLFVILFSVNGSKCKALEQDLIDMNEFYILQTANLNTQISNLSAQLANQKDPVSLTDSLCTVLLSQKDKAPAAVFSIRVDECIKRLEALKTADTAKEPEADASAQDKPIIIVTTPDEQLNKSDAQAENDAVKSPEPESLPESAKSENAEQKKP